MNRTSVYLLMVLSKVSIGYVVGLDYKNPYVSPYRMFQQFKHHPYIANFLEGGTCLKYGGFSLSLSLLFYSYFFRFVD